MDLVRRGRRTQDPPRRVWRIHDWLTHFNAPEVTESDVIEALALRSGTDCWMLNDGANEGETGWWIELETALSIPSAIGLPRSALKSVASALMNCTESEDHLSTSLCPCGAKLTMKHTGARGDCNYVHSLQSSFNMGTLSVDILRELAVWVHRDELWGVLISLKALGIRFPEESGFNERLKRSHVVERWSGLQHYYVSLPDYVMHGPLNEWYEHEGVKKGKKLTAVYRDGVERRRVEFHFGGGIKSERTYNRAGEPHGTWRVYNTRQQVVIEEEYLSGSLQGVVRAWDDEGRLTLRERWMWGKRHGESESWSMGVRRTRGQYQHGNRVGVWREWHKNGSLRSEISYNDSGRPHGAATKWFSNGVVHEQGRWSDGAYVPWIRCSDDGAVLERHCIADGQQTMSFIRV